MITCHFENNNLANLRHVTVNCLVIRDKSILLARRSHELLEGGKWGLLGGFLEQDETCIDGARREVHYGTI